MSSNVKYACPLIDRTIETFKSLQKDLDNNYQEDDFLNLVSGEIYELICKWGVLEELRTTCDELRTYGSKLEDEILSLQTEIDLLQQENRDLEEELQNA